MARRSQCDQSWNGEKIGYMLSGKQESGTKSEIVETAFGCGRKSRNNQGYFHYCFALFRIVKTHLLKKQKPAEASSCVYVWILAPGQEDSTSAILRACHPYGLHRLLRS